MLSTGCRPVQEVELLELPDNTPEVVPITCNGILGHFVVRTKTVVDEHFKEHKVTSFARETGTNNPWKSAMHIATAGVRRACPSCLLSCQTCNLVSVRACLISSSLRTLISKHRAVSAMHAASCPFAHNVRKLT